MAHISSKFNSNFFFANACSDSSPNPSLDPFPDTYPEVSPDTYPEVSPDTYPEVSPDLSSEACSDISDGVLKASAPGSLMLFGEHAVLQKKKALVMAIDKRIHVSLIPRDDDKIIIHSILAQHESTLKTLATNIHIPLELSFVFSAIKSYSSKLDKGFILKIDSDFSHTVGFGSSAAVVVATLRVLSRAYDSKPLTGKELFLAAKKVITSVQGMGSGADVAASIFGGLLLFCVDPLIIEPIAPLSTLPPIKVVYSGYKTPTAEVVCRVRDKFKNNVEDLNNLYNDIDLCTQQAITSLKSEDWQSVGQAMNTAQEFMKKLGVSDDILEQKIAALRRDSNILGAKISGAGLGDCIIGLGTTTAQISGEIAVLPSMRGVDDDSH